MFGVAKMGIMVFKVGVHQVFVLALFLFMVLVDFVTGLTWHGVLGEVLVF